MECLVYAKQDRDVRVKAEDCSVLEMKALRLLGMIKHPVTIRKLTWHDCAGRIVNQATVAMRLDWLKNEFLTRIVMDTFNYQKTEIDVIVRMTNTPCNLGGHRWYFLCPLLHDGVECGRRTHKLYLPEGNMFFGCRQCHDLTYKSTCEGAVNRRFRKHCKAYKRAHNFKQIQKDRFLERERPEPKYQRPESAT